MEKDQSFVEMVVKEIVDNPDKVKTERKVDEMGVLIELTVDPTDMGKIIGKEGKTAKAIRTLLRVLGAKEHARVNLKIIEPEGREVPIGNDDNGQDDSAPIASSPKTDVAMDDEASDVTPLEESSTDII
jgi:hypothetical protein